ncbi:AraC family transcriptional regulator [Carboxylicivirga sp. M1479]|uniref:helix-turn-helix domain-containing protein n=1 Tax=Carboxylicivirga sp. M1479 TaxID=2594476 RepID=UPI00163DD67C|nr:helix-turn-helix domain-containing protein [Carboxylicivirga sp. M1479]
MWIHFVPLLIRFIAFSPFYFQSGDAKVKILVADTTPWLDTLFKLNDIVIILQGIIYTILSMRILHHFQYFRERRMTKVQRNAVSWLKQFVITNVFLWSIGVSGSIFYMLRIDVPFNLFNIYYLGLTILTIWMGYFTLRKPHLFSEAQELKSLTKYLGMSKSELEELAIKNKADLHKLIHFIESQKPYLNTSLNLQHLASGTGLAKNRISDIFNTELKKTFYDVINEYRTKEVIELMKKGVHESHTLTHLAEMAGFNSKATFNRIFKKITGKTPSEYTSELPDSKN